MKYIILIAAIIYSGVAFGKKVIIINSGFVFSPDSVSINLGDTIIFQLGSIHNAVEVSQATWNANGTTLLSGGFSTPFAGGEIKNLAIGEHFYVCTNHAFMGMKGRIFVNEAALINNNLLDKTFIDVYPNPTKGKITLSSDIDFTKSNEITIYNYLGYFIDFKENPIKFYDNELDLTNYPKGIYFMQIVAENKKYIAKIIID